MTDEPRRLPISEADFNLWKHHPVTAVFLTFVRDYAGVMRKEAIDRWEAGNLVLSDEKEMRGRLLAWSDISELEFESIRSFYEGEKIENETEASEE